MKNYIEKIKGIFNKNNYLELEEKRYPSISFRSSKIIDSKLVERYFIKKMEQIKFGDRVNCCLSDIIEVLLLKLGLKVSDVVFIQDINYVTDKDNIGYDYVVDFSLNDVNLYKLIFRYKGIYDTRPVVIFVKDNESYGYNIDIRDIDNGFMDLHDLFYECDTEYGVYRRDYSYMRANYMVRWGYYTLNLELHMPNGYRHDSKYIYKLENEDKLRDCLLDLKFPLRIDKLYKEIQREFLGDISKYPIIKLECMEFDHFIGEDVIRDKILLIRGECKTFGMTRDNKTIMLEHNGDWSYKLLDSNMEVKLSMKIEDDDVSYTIHGRTKEELDKYLDSYVKTDMMDANNEVNKIKKLVKVMFEKEDKNYVW